MGILFSGISRIYPASEPILERTGNGVPPLTNSSSCIRQSRATSISALLRQAPQEFIVFIHGPGRVVADFLQKLVVLFTEIDEWKKRLFGLHVAKQLTDTEFITLR